MRGVKGRAALAAIAMAGAALAGCGGSDSPPDATTSPSLSTSMSASGSASPANQTSVPQSSSPKTSSSATSVTGSNAPLTKDACSLLTVDEVLALAHANARGYSPSTTPVPQPGKTSDTERECTWTYETTHGEGYFQTTSNSGLAMRLSRITPDSKAQWYCNLSTDNTKAAPLQVGDYAEAIEAIACVRKGAVAIRFDFLGPYDGAVPAAPPAAYEGVLQASISRAGNG